MKFFLGLILLMLCGCGHNTLVFSTGKRLNVGINPNTFETGIQYSDVEQITLVEKDNAILTVEMKDTLESDGKRTSKVSKIIYEIKEQTTGADVDLATVNK